MKSANLSAIVSQAWMDVQAEARRCEREQITTLHDWRRAKNGRWVDDGPIHHVRFENLFNRSSVFFEAFQPDAKVGRR